MPEAWIIDAVRTPRGKGKKDTGALSGVHPQQLLAQSLKALQARNGFDPKDVEDVIAGCVSAFGEQAACIARNGVLARVVDQYDDGNVAAVAGLGRGGEDGPREHHEKGAHESRMHPPLECRAASGSHVVLPEEHRTATRSHLARYPRCLVLGRHHSRSDL